MLVPGVYGHVHLLDPSMAPHPLGIQIYSQAPPSLEGSHTFRQPCIPSLGKKEAYNFLMMPHRFTAALIASLLTLYVVVHGDSTLTFHGNACLPMLRMDICNLC